MLGAAVLSREGFVVKKQQNLLLSLSTNKQITRGLERFFLFL
jgi:hypothetical protein